LNEGRPGFEIVGLVFAGGVEKVAVGFKEVKGALRTGFT
jgi:hypothetical protein